MDNSLTPRIPKTVNNYAFSAAHCIPRIWKSQFQTFPRAPDIQTEVFRGLSEPLSGKFRGKVKVKFALMLN
jgi:hypothetical protein